MSDSRFSHNPSRVGSMKIKTIRIENFRSFQDETIVLNAYTCLVGPNGAGKSTVLAALNIFFPERSRRSTDVSKLADEHYLRTQTSNPISITLTFDALNEVASEERAAYVRGGQLVETAEALFHL